MSNHSETRSGHDLLTIRRRLGTFALSRPYLVLTLICAILYFPGLASLPPLDRDEARFAQATAQMLESGNYIDIRFQDAPRYQKPVGIYWLQAVSVSLFSNVEAREIWAYRIPSALSGLIAVLMTFWGLRRLFDQRTAFAGAILLSISIVVMAEANIAKTDAALLAATTTAMFCLGTIYIGAREGQAAAIFTVPGPVSLAFWFALGTGILIKGPVIAMICGLTVLSLCALDRNIAWLRRLNALPGIVILALILLPWTSAIWQLTDGAFFQSSLGNDMLDKVSSGQESHGAPPGYFALLSFVTFWPGSIFLLPALYWAWQNRGNRQIRFLLAWLVPAWLVFEIVPTKLPHYTMPLYPALAGLCGAWLTGISQASNAKPDLGGKLGRINIAIAGLTTLALGALLAPLPILEQSVAGPAIFALLFLAVAFYALFYSQLRVNSIGLLGLLLIAAAVWNFAMKEVTIPSLRSLYVSPALANAVRTVQPAGKLSLAVSGYSEPSLVFLLGTDTALVEPREAARLLRKVDGAIAIVESRKQEEFLERAAKLGLTVKETEKVNGVNYSRGDDVRLTLYRRVDE